MDQENKQNDYLTRFERYRLAMALAKSMLSSEIITEEEYAIIDTIMTKKYNVSSSIFSF